MISYGRVYYGNTVRRAYDTFVDIYFRKYESTCRALLYSVHDVKMDRQQNSS
jgi:hypothetical protein